MKKILLLVMALALVMTLVGCGAGDVGGSSNAPQESAPVVSEKPLTEEEVEDTLEGLESYLVSGGLLGKEEVQQMQASFIGAKAGKRYRYKVGDVSVTTELYEYDPANLNATAKDYIAQVKKDGGFTILDQKVTGALLSDSGKYLMIYTDTSDKEENVKRAEEIKAAFCAFKKQA